MNRAMRRQQARVARARPNRSRAQYTNVLTLENDCFDSIDRLFLAIRHGYLRQDAAGFVLTGIDGRDFHVVSALDGWCCFWRELAEETGMDYDGSAMERLCKALEYEKPLTLAEVDAAARVLEVQRALYRTIPQGVRRRVYDRVHAEIVREDEIRELMRMRNGNQ